MDATLLEQLKDLRINLETVPDEGTRVKIALLLKAIEYLVSEHNHLKDENQKLKDEINRLKGEQGKPDIRPQSTGSTDHSSEQDRKPPEDKNNPSNKSGKPGKKSKKSKKKKHKITVHETRHCPVDKATLPEDAQFKGLDSIVIQGIHIQAHNVQFKREVYYSPSAGKRFIAPMPSGYQGEFSPELKAWIITCHHDYQITEPAIHRMLMDIGIHISPATISRILTGKDGQSAHTDIFHTEKQEIVIAGKQSTAYQQTDDTSARVKGKNHYTHILCNPYYTAYFTRPHKDRLTVLEILTGEPLRFSVSAAALELIQELKIPGKYLQSIANFFAAQQQVDVDRKTLDALLNTLYPDPNKHIKNRQIILEACALIAYRHRDDAIKILVCDDAPQFKYLTLYLALCWVHEGRHYKKLSPFRTENQEKLDRFLDLFWAFYHCLLGYKTAPDPDKAERLKQTFDILFNLTTGYEELDDRIAKTRAKKDNLLLVLQHPQIPLHNNTSELAARRQARYRDISLHTVTDEGTQAKDDMMSVAQTARKLGVSVYHYVRDRIAGMFAMPSLADLITRQAESAFYSSG